jgi:hypothetical protein
MNNDRSLPLATVDRMLQAALHGWRKWKIESEKEGDWESQGFDRQPLVLRSVIYIFDLGISRGENFSLCG